MERPTENDILFKSKNGNNFDYATINSQKGINNEHSLFLLIEGYRDASSKLLNELLNAEKVDWFKIDTLIYPILYTFRHYLELIIKDTVRNYNLIDKKISSDEIGFKKEHSIIKLWSLLKNRIIENYNGYDKETIQQCIMENTSVENMLIEINNLDEYSFGFRYPFQVVGDGKNINSKIVYMFGELKIDLNNLNSNMSKLINYFEGLNAQSLHLLDEIQTVKE